MRISYILQGLVKSDHFVERQVERKVSDAEVIRILKNGSKIIQDDGNTRYTLGVSQLIVDHSSRTLVTVHPGDRPSSGGTRLFSSEHEKMIRAMVKCA